MSKFLLLGLAVCCCLFGSLARAAWDPAWTQRLVLSVDTTAGGVATQAALDNVPVLVRLHTGNFPFLDAKPDGSDLRFIAADDKTPLKFHIERFDGLNELALVWVQLPRIAPGAKAEALNLYFGNAAAVAGGDAKGSFDAKQTLVMHFSDSTPLPQDSTANALHATTSTARAGAAGLIGGGLVFEGAQQLQISGGAALAGAADGYTVSFWIKPTNASDALLFAQGEGATALRLSLRGGRLVAQAGTLNVQSTAPLPPGGWQHVALVVKDGLALFVGGQEAGRSAGATPAVSGAVTVGRGFKGELDELQVSTTARSAEWLKFAAVTQGADAKLLMFGKPGAEAGGGGPGYLKILLDAVTLDGWIVIGILAVMFVISVWVMVTKTVFVTRMARDNDRFKTQFDAQMKALRPGDDGRSPAADVGTQVAHQRSQLYRLFAAGSHELRSRFAVYADQGRAPILSEQSIEAIRASVDARFVRETQLLNSSMVLLTISIAGGPFLGLLGTVVGVMITFAAIAAAGDVNVNAIAPGIAAALVATVAGLAVAIPALFGYNYLSTKISELNADMQVFIDEFITRVAENHSA